jgi:phage terminase small subunit
MPLDENGLTPKQAKFVENYLTNGYNGSKAARDAGYSKRSAAEIAQENLMKPLIRSCMRERMQKAAEKAGLTPEFLAEKMQLGINVAADHIKTTYKNNKGKVTHTEFNHDAANSMHKLLGEAHRVLDLYPEEKKAAESTVNVNMQPVKEELDKARGKF